MSRTKIEQRPRCSDRCKGRMGIETESEKGSGEQRIARIGLQVCTAVFSDVIVSSPPCTVLSSPTFIGKSLASIGKPTKRRQDILVRVPIALNVPRTKGTGAPTCHPIQRLLFSCDQHGRAHELKSRDASAITIKLASCWH